MLILAWAGPEAVSAFAEAVEPGQRPAIREMVARFEAEEWLSEHVGDGFGYFHVQVLVWFAVDDHHGDLGAPENCRWASLSSRSWGFGG
ncbi:hypothetical protein ACOBQX_03220 [Actinokineospora sp. G85]|uniref:hypothetical protein n=1 Tax=Actinokineospora sp. G85 TaxID=3406626 RepID=UPI003C75032A